MYKKNLTIRQKSRIQAILFLLGAAIICVGCFLSEPLQFHWLIWIGTIVFLSSPIYRLTAIKCPHCGSNMASCRVLPKCCPDCGKGLDETPCPKKEEPDEKR